MPIDMIKTTLYMTTLVYEQNNIILKLLLSEEDYSKLHNVLDAIKERIRKGESLNDISI